MQPLPHELVSFVVVIDAQRYGFLPFRANVSRRNLTKRRRSPHPLPHEVSKKSPWAFLSFILFSIRKQLFTILYSLFTILYSLLYVQPEKMVDNGPFSPFRRHAAFSRRSARFSAIIAPKTRVFAPFRRQSVDNDSKSATYAPSPAFRTPQQGRGPSAAANQPKFLAKQIIIAAI